jgi:5-formyltetrahydrofolate cyclo-ligase
MTGADEDHEALAAQKVALRDRLLTTRRRRPLTRVAVDSERIAAHLLESPPLRRAATVAAYVGIGHEPGTGVLLEALRARARRVILPVLLPDGDLDWATHDAELQPAGRGLLEPTGPRLGPWAISTADVVLAPALAVSRHGTRLGRGGGSYDRALGRLPLGTFTCALLFDDEYPVDVPVGSHDRPVVAVAQPSGIRLTDWARGPGSGRRPGPPPRG